MEIITSILVSLFLSYIPTLWSYFNVAHISERHSKGILFYLQNFHLLVLFIARILVWDLKGNLIV